MSLIQSITPCEDIQIPLTEVFTRTNPALTFESAGWLRFLTDPINNVGVEQIPQKVSPGDGKIRTVNVRHHIRLNEEEAETGFEIDCNPTETIGDTITSYDLDEDTDGNKVSRQVSLSDIRRNCTSSADWLANMILMMVNVMDRKIAQKMADQIPNVVGKFADDGYLKITQTQDSSGNNLQTLIEDVMFETMNSGYPGQVAMFGWGETFKYMQRLKAGCCVQTGIDLRDFMAQNPLSFMGDYRVENALGTSRFMTTTPGAVQVLQFVEYVGDKVSNDDSFEARTIRSPETGIVYDFFMERKCGDQYVMTVRNATKLVGMPTDMFGTNDRLQGVTFVNEFAIVNP